MNRKLLVEFVLASSAVLLTPAAIAATSKAEISGFNIQLIDLDPMDGIAPAMTIAEPMGTFVHYYIVAEGLDERGSLSDFGTLQHDSLSGSVFSMAGADAFSSVAVLDARYGLVQAGSYQYFTFWLTPNSAAVFSATAAFETKAQHDSRNYAAAYMDGLLWYGARFSHLLSTANSPVDETASGTFYGELHTGSTQEGGMLSIGTTAIAQIQAVPEPGSWTMLLAGFAVVGLAARRATAGPPDLKKFIA